MEDKGKAKSISHTHSPITKGMLKVLKTKKKSYCLTQKGNHIRLPRTTSAALHDTYYLMYESLDITQLRRQLRGHKLTSTRVSLWMSSYYKDIYRQLTKLESKSLFLLQDYPPSSPGPCKTTIALTKRSSLLRVFKIYILNLDR